MMTSSVFLLIKHYLFLLMSLAHSVIIHSGVSAVNYGIEQYFHLVFVVCCFEDPTNCTSKSLHYIDEQLLSLVLCHNMVND